MVHGDLQDTLYACKCLNVKLQSTPQVDSQPNVPSATEYTPVYVAHDEDIQIAYPQLTLRTRKRGPFISDPTLCARYTSLTCLCCQVLVYRIHQIVSTDDSFNLKEGPIITKGWAETVVLRNASGWVEVSHDVLRGEAIRRQESSPQFSPLFRIVLPTTPASPSPAETTPEPSSILNAIPKYQLPFIPPVFPEVKATRSLFAALASVATQESASTRSSVEEYLDGVVREKVAEIDRAEAQLKRDVQLLLNKYNEGIKKAEQEQSALDAQSSQASATSNHIPGPASPSSPKFTGVPASVIRDFVPIGSPQPSQSVAVPSASRSAPRVSALSASLVTSFHHPRAQSDSSPSPAADSFRSRTPDTLQSASSITLTSPLANSDVRNVFQFRRMVDDDMNTAASYRYFLLEEEMERKRQAESNANDRPVAEETSSHAGPSTSRKPAGEVGKGKEKRKPDEAKKEEDGSVVVDANLSPSPKSKGKRKVTFDVQVPNSDTVEENEDIMANVDTGDMIFDLEEETARPTRVVKNVLPLIESQPVAPSRPSRPRKQNLLGLPQSFPGLRPASLPAPSHLPLSPSIGVPRDESSSSGTVVDSVQDDIQMSSDVTGSTGETTEDHPANSSTSSLSRVHDDKILDMLAASVPSHRAAWKNDNKLYETFVRRNRLLNDEEDNFDDFVAEDDAVDDQEEAAPTHTGIPGSVPIQIVRRTSKPQPAALSLASYRPETLLSNTASQPMPTQSPNRPPASIRRAAYAERDLERGIDPGALDFVPEEENEDEQEKEDENTSQVNGRGRDRAQRILEARSKIPADGMLHSMI